MKQLWMKALLTAALLVPTPDAIQAQSPSGSTAPAQTPTSAAPGQSGAPASASPSAAPAQPSQPTRIEMKGRDGNMTIEITPEESEKFREMMRDPVVQENIGKQIDRIGSNFKGEWRGIAVLIFLTPFAFFALIGFMVWWGFRRSRERMQARMEMHNALLAKFSTGAEFTEFIASKGGREYIEQLTMPSHHHPNGQLWRSAWIGYVCTAMGAGLLMVQVIQGGSLVGSVILLAIGIGHLLAMRAAKKHEESIPPASLPGATPPAGGTIST